MSEKLRAYLYLHLCVFIWGFTAILGKLISLKALPLVWWRVALCCAALWMLIPRAQLRSMDRAMILRLFGIGALVGLHWLCFYGAIKLSNASVGVVSMATASFFAALLEPVLFRRPLKWHELSLGLLVIPGIALIVGAIDWEMRWGFAVGIAAAFLAALFTALNKQVLDSPHPPPPFAMTLAELGGGLILCSLILPIYLLRYPETPMAIQGADWMWIPVLAFVCTLAPYYLTLLAMRHISAFATNLSVNLEPVYGVVLAALIFGEHREMNAHFYIGVGVIIAAVFGHPLLKHYVERDF
ncbi:MAG: DMT family transporter [Saprospiraceae bacterium]